MKIVRPAMVAVWFAVIGLLSSSTSLAAPEILSGLVDSASGNNQALLVGAPNGLPGVDHDLANINAIATNSAYRFQTTSLYDGQATKQALLDNLKTISTKVGTNGSLLFYFSGHGNDGIIAATNLEIVEVGEIREAIEQGRTSVGPLQRLVLLFDSCNSGSLLNPFGFLGSTDAPVSNTTGQSFADSVMREFTASRSHDSYWQKLIVFASSTAAEESEGNDDGGLFTLGMKQAFPEVIAADGTIGDFISKTQQYTGEDQHPVARLVPDSLSGEKLKNVN